MSRRNGDKRSGRRENEVKEAVTIRHTPPLDPGRSKETEGGHFSDRRRRTEREEPQSCDSEKRRK